MEKIVNAWPAEWPRSLNYPEQPVFAFLDQTADRVPDRLAIIFGGMELTFGDVKTLSDRFAAALAALGIQKGEICIKGPQVMQGYWNKPEETDNVLKDGWLHSGDIGHMDEDGYFYITDRKKDMIIYKGYNVYPRELEEILFTHPEVAQCAVVGKPDLDVGEAPVAFVQLMPDAHVDHTQLMAFINDQVAAYKKIRDVRFLDAIPVSAAGKVLKRELRNML